MLAIIIKKCLENIIKWYKMKKKMFGKYNKMI